MSIISQKVTISRKKSLLSTTALADSDTEDSDPEIVEAEPEDENPEDNDVSEAVSEEEIAEAAVNADAGSTIDTSALQAAADSAKKLVQTDYTEESWSVLSDALGYAETVLEEPEDQESVDEALVNLTQAVNGLARKESMSSVSIGGVTYYYADTAGDAENTVYQVSITTGRGPSATTTVYNYVKSDLKQVGDSSYCMITVPADAALTGTLYGYGSGTAYTYREIYTELGVTGMEDSAYDVVTSATHLTNFHAKDVASTVTYGTDENGNKTITGIELGKAEKTVDADAYVTASILKAAGETLTDEQQAVLDITLKKNPMVKPADSTVEVKAASASYSTSSFGVGEFVINPDTASAGYVWSEYWDKVYAATISDGSTTVGAVHWIDMYGEESSSGYHYNKLEIALNNGTSKGSNKAEVSRYSAFFDENTGNVKPGTYTITVYADGYTPLTAQVTIEKYDPELQIDPEAADAVESISAVCGDDPVQIRVKANTSVRYTSSDEAVVKVDENGLVTIVGAGEAVIKVTAGDDIYKDASLEISVTIAEEEITINDATVEEGGTDDVVITCSRRFDRFEGVMMDGKELTEGTDYTAAEGSTIVTLKGEYVSALSVGVHDMTLLYTDGTNVSAKVTVKEKSAEQKKNGSENDDSKNNTTPVKTGDESNPFVWMIVLCCAAAALVFTMKTARGGKK